MNRLKKKLKAILMSVLTAGLLPSSNCCAVFAEQKSLEAMSASFAKTGPKSAQARALTIKARDLILSLHCEQALSLVNRAIALEPANAWPYFFRAEAIRQTSAETCDLKLATKDYEEAIKRNPALEEPYAGLAMLYSESDNNEMAFKTLARLPKMTAQGVAVHQALAEIYAGAQSYDKAIAEFTWLINGEPKRTDFRRKRGACYAAKNDFPKAIADYTAALVVNPYETGCMRLRAAASEKLGKWIDAASDYQKIIAIEPKNDGGYKLHAKTMLRLNRPQDAIEDYTKVLKFAPDDSDALTNRGEIYLKLRDSTRALKDLSAAIDGEPGLAKRAYFLRAQCYQASGDISRAQADIAKAKRQSSL